MSKPIDKKEKIDRKQLTWVTVVIILLLLLAGKLFLLQMRALVSLVASDQTYEVYIDDRLELMTEEEREALEKQLSGLTVYGNMVFLDTGAHDYSSVRRYAEESYRDLCGREPGVVFLIDMDNREIWLAATGAPKNRLTSAICYEITDRTYQYATDGDYYACAGATFAEVQNILEGGYLIPVMRILISLFLSLIAALTVNLIRLVDSRTIRPEPANSPAIYGRFMKNRCHRVIYKTEKKRYYESSDSGGGGGSSGGGGGGFSGGGHSF